MFFKKNNSSRSDAGDRDADFTGKWISTFGPLEITRNGDGIRGEYRFGTVRGEIVGAVAGSRLSFRYREPSVAGEGWFDLVRPCRFAGKWRPDGSDRWFDWNGERLYEGIWNSSFGPLRLVHNGDGTVCGFYELGGPSDIKGSIDGNRLSFSYREPQAGGEGIFQLSDDQMSFSGEWKQEGQSSWQQWHGQRMMPMPGIIWLVVLESHWQRYLMEKEYSFGAMLEAFFSRLPHVNIRHRFFTDGESLRQWSRGLMYIPEPVVLVVASHATDDGLNAMGAIIGPEYLLEGVRYADSLYLVHFSSCLIMGRTGPGSMAAELHALKRFPVSGYTTSVDWAASAIIEFTYLDFILERGMPPALASEQVCKTMAFAKESAPEGSPFPAAGFYTLHPD